MDVRPVDIQLMMNSSEINKTNETGKYSQQIFSEHLEQRTQEDLQKTAGIEKTEEETISDKQESEKGQYRGRKGRHRREKEKENGRPKGSTSLFDVKI